MSDEQSLCARCAASGGSCCRNTQIFLTGGDINRISSAVSGNGFWELAPPSDGESAPDFDWDPVWARIFGNDGTRRVLRHEPGGGCHFLTATGCSLSMQVRPLVCRLYPFDYNCDTIKGVHGHLCPSPEQQNAPLLLAMLSMNRDEAEGWRTELYAEIETEFPRA